MSPKAPALTVPVSWSPLTVAVQLSVIGIGTVMSIFHLMVSPSLVPSLTGSPNNGSLPPWNS